jgi:ribosomal protein S8
MRMNPIPCNLCLTVKGIVQQTKASRSALSLHKLALYVSTITNLPKIDISLTRLNEIIGFKSHSKGKTYNINLISNLLEQLVSSGFIESFKKQEMTNPTCFEISYLREPSKGKSENIKGNKGTVRNKEAGKRVIKQRVESQAGGNEQLEINAFAPEREGFNCKKPILKQQVGISFSPPD